jgi:hypothetical protein
MKITKETAKRAMKAGTAVVLRYAADGRRLPDATEWTPDETWATATKDGNQYYILDRRDMRRVDHVEA